MVVRELITLLGFELKDAPLKQYDKQIDSTKEKSGGLANAARGVSTAWKIAAAAVAVGVGWISKNIIEATVEMEKYRTQMQVFTGSAESAAEALADLRDKTSDALFGTGTLVNAYKQLRTVGVGAQDTSRIIDVLGDVANGSAENFSALSGILTNVATTGKVNERTLKQLTNAGFGVNDMAQGLGVSVEQLNKDIASGKIGFKELSKAMEGATKEGGRFYMNAANQAMTLGGSIKIIKSLISDIGEAIGREAAPALANLIGYVTQLIKLGKTGLVDFGAKAFNYLIHVIAQVIIFFEVLNMRMNKYGGSFTALKGIFQDVFGFFQSVIQSAWPALLNLAQLILVAFKPIQAFVKPILESLKPIFRSVFGLLASIIGELIPIVNGLTPHFEGIGKAIGGAFEKILPLLENIKRAILAAFKPIKAFLKPIIESLKPLFEKVFGAIGRLFSQAGKDTNGLAGIIEKLTPLFSFLGNIVSVFIDIFGAGLAWIIDLIGPFIKYILIIIGVIKAWSIVQGILNAVMSMNPIGLIIMAVVALIAIIGLLVKNWDKVVAALKSAFEAIGNFFVKIWEGIKSFFSKVIDFIKKNALNILNVILTILFFPAGIIMAVVRLIIKHWDTIKEALLATFEKIKEVFSKVGEFFAGVFGKVKEIAGAVWDKMPDGVKNVFIKIKNIISAVIDEIKVIINGIKDFFTGLWGALKQGPVATFAYLKTSFKKVLAYIIDLWKRLLAAVKKVFQDIAQAARTVWNSIVDVARSVVDRIKEVWKTITGFFSGLWDGIKNIAESVWNGIKNAVFSIVDSIKNIWLNFLGFFTGLWEAIKAGPSETIEYIKNAFLNLFENIKEKFFGFINIIQEGWEKVKGFFSGIGQGVADFFTGGSGKNNKTGGNNASRTATAPSQTLSGSAMQSAASSNVYNNGGNSSQTINASSNISVNVPPGTTQEQARAISQQVDRAVQNSLASAIGGARGTIPSPEVRRN